MAAVQKSLGEKLRNLRESYHLSQGQVAQALNIDRSTYTNYELDKTRPNLETLVKLAHIYKVPSTYLLPDDGNRSGSLKDTERIDALLGSLSKEERGLIVFYRSLSPEQQRQMRSNMAKLAKKQS